MRPKFPYYSHTNPSHCIPLWLEKFYTNWTSLCGYLIPLNLLTCLVDLTYHHHMCPRLTWTPLKGWLEVGRQTYPCKMVPNKGDMLILLGSRFVDETYRCFLMQHRWVSFFWLRLAPHFFNKCYFEFHETCLNVGQQFPKQLKKITLQLHNFETCSEFPCFNCYSPVVQYVTYINMYCN